MRLIPLLLSMLIFSRAGWAELPSVKVIALFTDKALLLVNGERKLMKKGETLQGVTLLSSSGRGAVVRLDQGQEIHLNINQKIQHAYRKADNKKLTIYADKAGMFTLTGKINGKATKFLLDTGATYIALSETEADRLGIPYETAQKANIQTASEVVPAWNIKLDSVKVGHIRVPQVDAVVLRGDYPRLVLLGMSFLQHLKLQRNGASMVLEQKY